MVSNHFEECSLDGFSILEHSLPFLVPCHYHQISQRYNTILDEKLLIIVLSRCKHFHFQIFCLLQCLFFLSLFFKFSLFFGFLFSQYFLLEFFFFLRFLLKFSFQLGLFFLFVAFLEEFSFLFPLGGSFLHDDYLSGFLGYFDDRSSLSASML